MSELARAAEDYLRTRRALGFKLTRAGQLLGQFVAFMDQAALPTITTDAALAWATRPVDTDPQWWGSRLGVVRTFASWLTAFDPALRRARASSTSARITRWRSSSTRISSSGVSM